MVRFATRPGCHLCDVARPVVAAAVGRLGGAVEEVNVDEDDALLTEYGLRIPVVLSPDGEVLAEGVIEPRPLRKALRRWGAGGG